MVKSVCDLQATDHASIYIQQAAVRFLGNWAEASVMNCGKIASMHGGQALTRIAADAASAGHNRQLEYEIVRTMALLARDCPLRHSLGVQTWLQQLLYIAADAAAMKHWKLTSQVGFLQLFSFDHGDCTDHGSACCHNHACSVLYVKAAVHTILRQPV